MPVWVFEVLLLTMPSFLPLLPFLLDINPSIFSVPFLDAAWSPFSLVARPSLSRQVPQMVHSGELHARFRRFNSPVSSLVKPFLSRSSPIPAVQMSNHTLLTNPGCFFFSLSCPPRGLGSSPPSGMLAFSFPLPFSTSSESSKRAVFPKV